MINVLALDGYMGKEPETKMIGEQQKTTFSLAVNKKTKQGS